MPHGPGQIISVLFSKCGGEVVYGSTFMPGLADIKEVGLFELKQGWIVFVKLLKNLCHDNLSHELGFILYFILLTIEV